MSNTDINKVNALVDAKLQDTLGQSRYLQFKSITSKYQRAEYLFNEILRVLGVNESNKAEYVDLINTINSAITLLVSRNPEATVEYDAFQYILTIHEMCKKLIKNDDEKLTRVTVLLYEIVGLT